MTEDLNKAASYCPTCGAEYREGFTVCADDGAKLIPGTPPPEPFRAPEPEPPPTETGARWMAVASFPHEKEARMLSGRLVNEGIDARVYPEFQASYYGGSVNIPVQVLVPEDRAAEARELIEQLERA